MDERLPSKELGLHLERNGKELRLYDPEPENGCRRRRKLTEQAKEAHRREVELHRQEEMARKRAEAQVERLQRELEELRRRAAKDQRGTRP